MPIYPIKDEKGKTVKYRVDINYKDENGNYKRITKMNKNTTTLASAKKLEHQLLQELNYLKSDNITYQELYDEYMTVKETEIKFTTLGKTEMNQRLYILPFFAKKNIDEITTKDVQRWKLEIEKKGLAHQTKNNIFSSLRAVLSFGVKFHGLQNNPAIACGNFVNKEYKKDKLNYWTLEEFTSFNDKLKEFCLEKEQKNDLDTFIYWGYYTLFNILFYAGLRKGEAQALKWADYDPISKTISVTKSIAQKQKDAPWLITTPKNRSSVRTIKISNKLCSILNEQLSRYKDKVYLFDEKDSSWFICGGLEPLRNTSVENIFKDNTSAASLKTIRIHDLRHSFASLLVNGGIDIKIIAELMGHAKVDLTWNLYSHLYPNAQDKATSYIDSL